LAVRKETVVESSPANLELSLGEARALAAAGTRLALQRLAPPPDAEETERTLIRCTMNPNGTWRVQVNEAVGLVAVGDLRLLVEPKIPRSHLFHLFSRSDLFPRFDPSYGAAASGSHLWQLVSEWYVTSLEQVIRRDLVRDYLPRLEALVAARGQIDALATADVYYQGRLELICDFEEFGSDTPLNRVLKAAALAVAGSSELSGGVRRRAMSAATRMEDVGLLEPADLRVGLDRRTAHCRDALALARNVLANIRRTLRHGEELVWTFLIRTPDLVESGVRNEVNDRLCHKWPIFKEPIPLIGSDLTVAPDLIIGHGHAIADVKYKVASGRWGRSDLYEVVAFAAAAESTRAAVIGFRTTDAARPSDVQVGDVRVRYFAWNAQEDVSPMEAADAVANELSAWLNTSG
jgi:5-methylcytosine-specific restriction enzyme subunit McrC